MNLKERITEAMKAAMKDRNKVRVAALRLIRDAIQKTEINDNVTLDDAGVIAVLARLVKQRQESIQAFESGGRADLLEREQADLSIIREFMPEMMSPDELSKLVAKAISDTGAKSPSDIGMVMKALKGSCEGRAGGAEVSAEAKKQLSGP